jgi:hypothetical protein
MWITIVASFVTVLVAVIGIYTDKYAAKPKCSRLERCLKLNRVGVALLVLAMVAFATSVVSAMQEAASVAGEHKQHLETEARAKRLELGVQEANARAAEVSSELRAAREQVANLETAAAKTGAAVRAVAQIQEVMQRQAGIEATIEELTEGQLQVIGGFINNLTETMNNMGRLDLNKSTDEQVELYADTAVRVCESMSQVHESIRELFETLHVEYMLPGPITPDMDELRRFITVNRSTDGLKTVLHNYRAQMQQYEELVRQSVVPAAREEMRRETARIVEELKEQD